MNKIVKYVGTAMLLASAFLPQKSISSQIYSQRQSQYSKIESIDKENFLTIRTYIQKPSPIEEIAAEKEIFRNVPKRKNTISEEGLSLIKKYEGFSENRYSDVGHPAIGYGHRIVHGENYKKITKEKAEELLRKDTKWIDKVISAHVEINLNQNQYDAISSLIYNIGAGRFASSNLLKELNNKNFVEVSREFDKYINSGKNKNLSGLRERRQEERELFNSEDKNSVEYYLKTNPDLVKKMSTKIVTEVHQKIKENNSKDDNKNQKIAIKENSNILYISQNKNKTEEPKKSGLLAKAKKLKNIV